MPGMRDASPGSVNCMVSVSGNCLDPQGLWFMGRREQRSVYTEPRGEESSLEKRAPHAGARGRWRRKSLLPRWALELNREVAAFTRNHCPARCPSKRGGGVRRTCAQNLASQSPQPSSLVCAGLFQTRGAAPGSPPASLNRASAGSKFRAILVQED